MLDINFIRENRELVQNAINNKKVTPKADLDRLFELEKERSELIQTVDGLRNQRNEINKTIQGKPDQETVEKVKEIKDKISNLETKLEKVENSYLEILLQIPNITSPEMPIGENDAENFQIKTWGDIPKFDFKVKDHIEIGKDLDLIDLETAAKVSGARFYYLKNEAVLLQFALVQFVFETLGNREIIAKFAKEAGSPFDKPFSPVLPPVMMKPEIMKKMDRLDPIEDRFQTKLDELVLVGSAEHTMGPMHMDTIFKLNKLPIRYIGYSTAFRREAGSHGKDTKGILRVHQFDKLEMETFVPAENGEAEQKMIVMLQEYMVQQLNLPYQLIQICTGDTGKPDYNQIDLETWIPSQEKYRETHTSDYMTDYQARRLSIKYVDSNDEKQFVHMNDATAFAISRILIGILENYQQSDGTVKVPDVLVKYMGKDRISPKL